MKKFKKALATTIAVISAASVLCMPMGASADTEESYVISQFQECSGITTYASTSKTLSVPAYKQEQTKWCWATCTQMVLKYYGTSKTQTEIVNQVKGTTTAENVSGTSTEVKTALNDYLGVTSFKSVSGKFNTVKTWVGSGSPVIMFGTLTNSSGTTSQHAIVCYGYNTSDSTKRILYINDPYSGSTGTLTCSSDTATSFDMTVGSNSYTFSIGALVYTTSSISK